MKSIMADMVEKNKEENEPSIKRRLSDVKQSLHLISEENRVRFYAIKSKYYELQGKHKGSIYV